MVISTCSICGETFISKRRSSICQEKSTCRVIKSRQTKKAKAQAKKMQLDVETFALYESVCALAPNIKEQLNIALRLYDKEIFSLVLVTASQAISGAMLNKKVD